MPVLSNPTAVVLLLIAHCGSWTGAIHLGSFKVCPSCRDPLGAGRPPRDHNAAGSTTVLAQGEPCGVYTLSCAKGLRCVPPPREQSPLQALLQGRGVCAKHSRTIPTERPHPTGKTPYMHAHWWNHASEQMCECTRGMQSSVVETPQPGFALQPMLLCPFPTIEEAVSV